MLLLALVVLATTIFRVVRGTEGAGRGYAWVLSLVLGVVVLALGRGSDFLAIVGIALTGLLVVGPWLLEALARSAFGQGSLGWAVRLASTRAMLMLGAGLSRQQAILHGLVLLERDGVDRALAHFRTLAEASDEPSETALIHEQIVSMLLYGQRWDESIAHYEARFPPRYAALRPSLALGLMRAYGESGRLENAARLLRALEDGPLGADPRSSGLLSQARLTFLAYAGVAATVEHALADERRDVLGLSAASGALLEGIAWSRAGHLEHAQERLRQVERLADRREARLVDASRRVIETLGAAPPPEKLVLAPELGRYAEVVARRLETFVRVAPPLRRRGGLRVTWGFMAWLAGVYFVSKGLGQGALSLLWAGALTPEAMFDLGEGWRALSGVATTGDPVSVVLNIYGLWLAGPVFERIHGAGRMLLAGLGGGVLGLAGAGLAVSSLATTDAIFAGAHLVVTAIVAAAAWTLVPKPSRSIPARARRALFVPLGFMFVAQLLCAVPGVVALDVPPLGLLIATGWGILVACLPGRAERVWRWLGFSLGAAVLSASAWSWHAGPERAYAAGVDRTIPVGGVRVRLPRPFAPMDARVEVSGLVLPVQPGAIDALAIRAGHQVQLVAADLEHAPGPASSVLFAVDPSLRHELTIAIQPGVPEVLAASWSAIGGDPGGWRHVILRRNGAIVGVVVEPTFEGPGRRMALLASPPEALEAAPKLFARALVSP